MNQVNYQKELEKILQQAEKRKAEGEKPLRLFLHSCCAPCSSYCLEYLCPYFEITVFYFNPNISAEPEYRRRVAEQKRLIAAYNAEQRGYPIQIIEGDYEPSRFYEIAKGYEDCREGGERCFRCFDLRLRETALRAKAGEQGAVSMQDGEQGAVSTQDGEERAAGMRENRAGAAGEGVQKAPYDYFATTLTISPLKSAQKINEIGQAISAEYGIAWMPSDFKKKNGYKRSVELSAEYGLYRQDYCGCAFSKAERERERAEQERGRAE